MFVTIFQFGVQICGAAYMYAQEHSTNLYGLLIQRVIFLCELFLALGRTLTGKYDPNSHKLSVCAATV